ncbi:MAG: T9SS C-terminal target domain-containing protein [Balneola sp.]|nr:MAG: T9SS C-terminal target domain-containing protein [Balneola sp.]
MRILVLVIGTLLISCSNSSNVPVSSEDEAIGELSPLMLLPSAPQSANLAAAQAIHNDEIWSDGIAGLDLSGDGQVLGYWDENQPRLTHQEYSGRVTFEDSESGTNNAHATQMVGTMVASGIESDARGMAGSATVEAWNWNSDISEMATEAASGLLTSAHPYSETAGWTTNSSLCGSDPEWMWFTIESADSVKAYQFGYYDSQAEQWDSVAYLYPNYLIIKAAGNERGDGPDSQPLKHWKYDSDFNCVQDSTSVRELDGGSTGFESVNAASLAKNVLVVGAVESSSNSFDDLSSVSPISGSGFGPTDDGRIKPDIVAPTGVYTSTSSADDAYSTGSGTSAATAVVAGSVALIRQHYQDLNSDTLTSASLRALLAHTADDVENTGPDFKTGWGLMNTERAVRFLSSNSENPSGTILKDTLLTDGNTIQLSITHSSDRPLIVTVAWTDPQGISPSSLDDPTDILLVNDIDLSVTDPDLSSHQPWTLDQSNPDNLATTGDNDVDNIEQVYIENPSSGTYTVSISHEGSLNSGSQQISILVSDAEPEISIETIASGNWSNSSTWENGVVPSTSLQRAVLNHAITLDQTAGTRGITFDGSSAELILNENDLSLYGGVYYESGGAGFSGDTSSTLSILNWDADSDSLAFKASSEQLGELTINSDGDSVNMGSDLNIYSRLYLANGSLSTDNYSVTLLSDSLKTALLEKENGSIKGSLNYTRTFHSTNSGWRLISSPFGSSMFSVLQDSFHTQGGAWAEISVSQNQSNLFLFDSQDQSFSGYIGNDSTFTSGEGYPFYMYSSEFGGGDILPQGLKFNGTEPDSVILDLTRGSHDSLSYNLVGNPFAGSLDWHNIVSNSTNISTSYATWDPETQAYMYYSSSSQVGDAGRYIAPMQGFFVQATDTSPVLRFRQSQKSSSQPTYFGKQISAPIPQYIRFELKDDTKTVLDNQAHLIFNEVAGSGIDNWDMLRLKSLNGASSELSFESENGINVFEGRSSLAEVDEIPINLSVSEKGLYTINWALSKSIPENWQFTLHDDSHDVELDMRAFSEYSFTLSTLTSGRFRISINRTDEPNTENTDSPYTYSVAQNFPNPFNPTTTIQFSLAESVPVRIEVFNALGQRVALIVDEQLTAGYHQIPFNASSLSSGVYYYRIEAGSFVETRSMVLIK